MKNPLAIFSKNVGIDLGTANSLVYLAGRGIVINEPSITAINAKTNQVLAIGEEARKMIGRTPAHITVVRPLVNGVISDFEMTQEMLRHFLKRLSGSSIFYNFQKAVIGVSVIAKSLKVAGDKLTDDIMRFVREEFKLAIGEPTAEDLKVNIGSAIPQNEKLEMAVRGRDLATGLPREALVRETHVRAAIVKSLKSIVEAVKEVIELAPPELAGDILKRGVYLCGGGSLLRGMDALLARELGVAANIVDDPLTCVARGTGVAVENLAKYQLILDNPLRPRDIKI
ncbi:MAG: MreB/Mrl family cell shape determining protein [Parcubacteria group bacterium Gr01-1014_19]|nr:MAG: MreB/Mrl family cell shape determining protein [Parcubacteria group bacterium Gr01-1014_19]